MDTITGLIDIFLHLNDHLDAWAQAFGGWLYVILFAIVFCETGLVVTPFLPGDSLLFATGALAARDGSPLHIVWTILLLVVAAILGDAVNYSIGYRVGPRVFTHEAKANPTFWDKMRRFFFNKKHLDRTQEFYARHGGKTIIIARFVPIIRTFAPFVAGIGNMQYRRFALFNVSGAIAWVVSFSVAGYLFGGLDYIKRNFQYVIVAIIVLSIMPGVIEFLRHRRKKDPQTA
jgi:membrane-associated protein